ncbi:MAG TPA: ABC transporter permease [Gemmatimonadales bacterium]|nr:ABC transporter permease [Gemmatimonadales bacterium]
MMLHAVLEGMSLALDALRNNKLRSALTILGVVIGVATVMAMASIVNGIETQVMTAVNNAGPNTFYVMRYWSGGAPVNPDNLPQEVRIRPILREEDAAALRRVPEISYAEIGVQVFQRLEYQGVRTQAMIVYGADSRYMEVLGGTILRGRTFSRGELASSAAVVVLEAEAAEFLFGPMDPMGKRIRIGGRALNVIGIYQRPENLFEPPGQVIGAVVPFRTARSRWRYDETNALFIMAKAREDVPVDRAQDLATIALRTARGLRPAQPNTFDIITQDQILSLATNLTSIFFLVMTALSGVALLVGGIGVMAIMMVSVSDRTKEIGLRKAVGATRREILWQFLVEAATLTLIGGLCGIAVGLSAGELLKFALDIEAAVPVWSAVVATFVSVGIGLVFGMIPANRASRMDPVEALRHE